MSGSGPSEEEQWAEARAKGNRENGWAVPGPDGMAVGEDESPRILEEIFSGRRPMPPHRPKGPKPIIGWKPEDEEQRGDSGDSGDEPTPATQAPPATQAAPAAEGR